MNTKHRFFIRILRTGFILFFITQAFWEVSRHQFYWFGWYIEKPQTWWQKAMDISHIWWYGLSRESILWIGFTIAGVIFLALSIIMED